MQCFYCEKAPHPGGLRYGIRDAVGVCHDCGVGVCPKHGTKEEGKQLLCADCAAAQAARKAAQPKAA